jgi:hypothetical protein
MKRALFVSVCIAGVLATVSRVNAQFPGITLPGLGGGNGAMPSSPGYPVSDAATEINSYIVAISVAMGGMYGGFDPTMALPTDLQQQVSSARGLPLDTEIPTAYPTLWPGYSNASYNQAPQPGSPEGDMAVTLGTLQGTLQAGADQQNSQRAELTRLQALETESGAAAGVLQALEVGNEISLFASQQEMKLRNATNAQLNALVVAESNRQNKEAQGELESMAVAGENIDWDFTNNPNPPEPQVPLGAQ